MTDAYLMPLAVRLASERVRADAANTMRHDTTSDLSARLMCRVGVQDLGLVMAWVDQFASRPDADTSGENDQSRDEPIPSGDAASAPPCKSEWRPIESAPRDADVIVFFDGAVGEARQTDDGEWWWANTYREYHADIIHPTHWQPLPASPLGEG